MCVWFQSPLLWPDQASEKELEQTTDNILEESLSVNWELPILKAQQVYLVKAKAVLEHIYN